jgi:hypothetical protein
MGKGGYTHVGDVETKLIQNMRKEGLTWTQIMRITGRGRGAIAAAFIRKTTKRAEKKAGRPVLITHRIYKVLEQALIQLQKKANGEQEVTIEDVREKTGIEASTKVVREAFRQNGIIFRKLKPKLLLSAADRKGRYVWGLKRRRRSKLAWQSRPHAIIDNKKFQIYRDRKGREFAARRGVRGAYQKMVKKGEKVEPYHVKPKENLKFSAPGVLVTAAVIKGRIRMWEYVHDHSHTGRWNGQAAAAMYSGPLVKAMGKAYPGHGGKWEVLEDNDPTDYKSRKALKAKRDADIVTDDLPFRSPDLNVLDYSLWHAINARMRAQEKSFPKSRKETKQEFLARLRFTALTLPTAVVKNAVSDMHRRTRCLVKARGGLFHEG